MKRWLGAALFAIALTLAYTFGSVGPDSVTAQSGEPVESCPMWRIAGTQIIYRCEDDATGVVCFSQGVMLFCAVP